MPPRPVQLADVRRFWESNPLFAGESSHAPGSREFFEEHDRLATYEFSGQGVPDFFFQGVEPGRRVLDVGCGVGFWTAHLARRGARMSACDLTMAGTRITRQRLQLDRLPGDVCVGNAEGLPYRDASFDVVNCQGVIHHTPNTAECLREFHRVLRPGGRVNYSVYVRTLPLRSRAVWRAIRAAARLLVRMPGRGREAMFAVDDPAELVRMYDGVDNPLGKAYTPAEARGLVDGLFIVERELRFLIPRRALPVRMPDWLHLALTRRFGLLIGLSGRRVP